MTRRHGLLLAFGMGASLALALAVAVVAALHAGPARTAVALILAAPTATLAARAAGREFDRRWRP